MEVLPEMSEDFARGVFNLMDEDGSGSIDFKELACCLSILCRCSL
jgi:Ca2+-binding EF-hand superfamily protein